MFYFAFFFQFLYYLNLIKGFNQNFFLNIFNKLRYCHCIWFLYTLLSNFGIRGYLFSPDEGSCSFFTTRNNFCEFLASHVVVFQSDIQSYFSILLENAENERIIMRHA